MNIGIFVIWYDGYYEPHNSRVYFVDSVRDRFLVVDENSNFHWVSISDCELLKQEDEAGIESLKGERK